MLEEKDLLAIANMMDQKLHPVHKRLDNLDTRLDKLETDMTGVQQEFQALKGDICEMKGDIRKLKENSAVTREATNTLLEWAERVEVQIQVPLFQRAENE